MKQTEQNLKGKWAALYSVPQDAFHVETLQEYLKTNLRMSLNKYKIPGFIMIGLYDSEGDAHAIIDEVYKFMKEKKRNNDTARTNT